MELLRGPA